MGALYTSLKGAQNMDKSHNSCRKIDRVCYSLDMKYKFKAFGAPLFTTIFLIITWVLSAIVFGSSHSSISSLGDGIIDSSKFLIPIYVLLIIVNIALGISASKKEKQISLGQVEKQVSFLNNVKIIKNIVRVMTIIPVIILILLVIAFLNETRKKDAKIHLPNIVDKSMCTPETIVGFYPNGDPMYCLQQ